MPSYAIIGGSRGIGLEFVRQLYRVNVFFPLLRNGMAKKIILIGAEGAYGITKAAEHMVATKYATELESEGFTVVSVSPGWVDVSSTYSEPPPEENREKYNELKSIERLLVYIENIGPADSGSFKPSPEFDTSRL
ncbi:hypothetical protein DAEQUDRAFT_813730 [Daedalea quercina L-15889]|uniref:NAD(P)-binding protein n=1 Tax=Daedalea quercina L-15889 TaxID=1314783 RepID=A0A165MVW0_9APHY|nr:hypothetical protein DAEQUDRAFT_813730 [Daedalea quercina L-15889]